MTLSAMSRNVVSLLLAAGLVAPAAAALKPFQAEFDMYRDGKKLGVAVLTLKQTSGSQWQFDSVNEGTEGLAGMANVSIQESSQFVESDSGLAAQHYRFNQSMLFKKKQRTVDVQGTRVHLDDGDKQYDFDLPAGGVLDRNIIVLALMQDVPTATGDRDYPVADKREVGSQKYRFGAVESVETPAGKFDARRVDRIREQPGRTTTTWFAESIGWMPVRILQVEPDGENLELRLRKTGS
ncbi:DUF3108 domain-containing protein [Ahniella affigens]|nr:DUF3108 domain-containing protein [Ahniella affigens]